MIQGLSIAGDVFWILALGIMASMSWGAMKRIPGTVSMPVVGPGDRVLLRAPRLVALWSLVVVAFVIGALMKIESRSPGIELSAAIVWLGARVTLAPLMALLHLAQMRKSIEILEREGAV